MQPTPAQDIQSKIKSSMDKIDSILEPASQTGDQNEPLEKCKTFGNSEELSNYKEL